MHIVWDWNGTLFDDRDAILDATNEVFRSYGLPPMERACREVFDQVGLMLEGEPEKARAVLARLEAELREHRKRGLCLSAPKGGPDAKAN